MTKKKIRLTTIMRLKMTHDAASGETKREDSIMTTEIKKTSNPESKETKTSHLGAKKRRSRRKST
jgi:hypothetical protein